MHSSRSLFSFSAIGLSIVLVGCENKAFVASQKPFSSTHIAVPEPSTPNKLNQSLLIGLATFLGKGTSEFNAAQPLFLKSGGQPLILKDSNGLVHRSKEISISWRLVSLENTKKVSRQVLGPFASFESAHNLLLKLKDLGISSVVAHPNEWELWVSNDLQLPKELSSVLVEMTVSSVIKPVLISSNGSLLLNGPISINAPDGLRWNNGIFAGPFKLQKDAYGTWTLVEDVTLENYLKGVVPHEIGSGSPYSALAAQAVLARTWALANSKRFFIDGYHLCSDTQCQVYKNPGKANSEVKRAINNTAGDILTWQNKPIHGVYHASNGGVMASLTEAWSMDNVPYLEPKLDGTSNFTDRFKLPITSEKLVDILSGFDDVYGSQHSLFRWQRTFTSHQLMNILKPLNPNLGLVRDLKVTSRGPSRRVLSIEIIPFKKENSIVLRLDAIRKTLPNLPSTLFVVNQVHAGIWKFSGGGFGHGVGLSQAGAIDLAKRGWNHKKILRHYYPGAFYGPLRH